jgi:hypothetical protein
LHRFHRIEKLNKEHRRINLSTLQALRVFIVHSPDYSFSQEQLSRPGSFTEAASFGAKTAVILASWRLAHDVLKLSHVSICVHLRNVRICETCEIWMISVFADNELFALFTA